MHLFLCEWGFFVAQRLPIGSFRPFLSLADGDLKVLFQCSVCSLNALCQASKSYPRTPSSQKSNSPLWLAHLTAKAHSASVLCTFCPNPGLFPWPTYASPVPLLLPAHGLPIPALAKSVAQMSPRCRPDFARHRLRQTAKNSQPERLSRPG